jgi:GGDEF domain-containing protein
LAERLKTCTRETDLVARQGGDEFLILLADLEADGADEAIRLVAGRMYEALREPFDLNGVEFHARARPASACSADAADVETLMKNADVAMYRAKRLEPGGYLFFAGEGDDALQRLSFAGRLRPAETEGSTCSCARTAADWPRASGSPTRCPPKSSASSLAAVSRWGRRLSRGRHRVSRRAYAGACMGSRSGHQ